MSRGERAPSKEKQRRSLTHAPRSDSVRVSDFQKSLARTTSQFYRLPEPQPGEPTYACIRPVHWGFGMADGAELVLVAQVGDVTSDAGLIRRFSHCFRPLAEGRQ